MEQLQDWKQGPTFGATVPSPLYTPLSRTVPEIRLIIMHPAIEGGMVHCSLITVSLDSQPAYTALSYCWGSNLLADKILVNDRTVHVTKSLASALLHIRLHSGQEPITIWADALCINQDDTAEKEHQIPLMRSIYRQADKVIGWLGESADDSDFAIEMLTRIARELSMQENAEAQQNANIPNADPTAASLLPESSNKDTIEPTESTQVSQEHTFSDWLRNLTHNQLSAHIRNDHPRQSPSWLQRIIEPKDASATGGGIKVFNRLSQAISNLLIRPYWSRVWIRQEIALPKRILFLCGKSVISGDILLITITRLQVRGQMEPSNKDPLSWQLTHTSAMETINNIHMLRRLTLTGESLSLFTLTFLIREAKASNPRDHIYGLLGLVASDITVDYSCSVEGLYLEFTKRSIIALCPTPLDYAGLGYPRQFAGLPSWVPDLTSLSDIGTPWSVHHYRAMAGLSIAQAECRFDGWKLRMKAALVDEISDTWALKHEEGTPFYLQLNPVFQALFHLIVGNEHRITERGQFLKDLFHALMLGKSGNRTSSLRFHLSIDRELYVGFLLSIMMGMQDSASTRNARAFQDVVMREYNEFVAAYHDDHYFANAPIDTAMAFDDLLRSNALNQVLFHSVEGRIGLGLSVSQRGDSVCIAPGHRMPLLLRSEGQFYHLISTCYVQGLMKGEALGGDEYARGVSLGEVELI